MSAERDANRIVRSWLEDGPTGLPDHIFDAVLADVPTTPQRRPMWPAWRISTLDTRLRIAASAAAVLIIAIIGYQFLPGSGGTGGEPTPSPSPSPSPTAEPTPTPTRLPTPPPLSQTFDSTIGGISISYPEGWTTQAATQQATVATGASFGDLHADFMYDPVLTHNLFIQLVSLELGASTAAEWVAESTPFVECTSTEPFTVAGIDGAICAGEGGSVALVSTGGRGYVIVLYPASGEAELAFVDRAWFETILATVQLRPEDAINPSPAPS